MEVLLCGFASKRYWTDRAELERAFDLIRQAMGALCTTCILADDEFDFDCIEDRHNIVLIALPMSGAVQPKILDAAKGFYATYVYAGYVKGAFSDEICEKMLIHNAAPAVMDVYAVLKRTVSLTGLCVSQADLEKKIRVLLTYRKLRGSKLLLIGQTEPWVISSVRNWAQVKERFGIEVVQIGQAELQELYDATTAEESEEICRQWKDQAIDMIEPSIEDLYQASRFQAALMKLMKQYDAAGAALACFELLKTGTTSCLGVSAINCRTAYSVACEGDVDSAITMMVMKSLAQDSVWMANPNIQCDHTVNFVHCTAPTRVSGQNLPYILRNHHESGIGVSTQADLPKNVKMTACRISDNLSRMTVQNCIGLPGKYEPSCRTQLKIKFESFDKYIKSALGCHQVFVFEDIKEELLYFAELSGLTVL